MIRWTVDLAGIDMEADLKREELKKIYAPPVLTSKETWNPIDEQNLDASKRAELGEVWVLTPEELYDNNEERLILSTHIASPLVAVSTRASTAAYNNATAAAAAAAAAAAVDITAAAFPSVFTLPTMVSNNDTFNSAALLTTSHSTISADFLLDSPKKKELRVFSDFLNQQGKQTVTTVVMHQPNYRGIDIVNTFLQKAMQTDEHLSELYSSNGRLYKLYIADEYTGEDEMAVQLDRDAQNFLCYAVHPQPAAKLFLFPQRTELRPTIPRDVTFIVQVRPLDPQAKPVQRLCVVPADMLAESLEVTVSRHLPASAIVPGSLRIKYGPLELNINESYNFGAGCGQMMCPIAEHTMLSLYRFGVTEVVVNGHGVEEQATNAVENLMEDIEINMNVDEAMAFQQFEVICINRYGARQQRVLCVDGEHLYTMRPNSDEVPKTTERMVKDIEEVRLFPNRPKYMEIVYAKTSHFDDDNIECATTYNCALLDEKLRVVRRELRKRAEQEAARAEKETTMHRVLAGLRSKWFGS